MTGDESSWVVSLIELGDLLSTLPAGLLVNRTGRKPLLLSTGPMFIFSWLLVLSTRSVEVLYIVRLIQGGDHSYFHS
jgi:MFS family permease